MRSFGRALTAGSVTWLLPALLSAQEVSTAVQADVQQGASADASGADTGADTGALPEPAAVGRAHNTWNGSSGGVRVIDGSSGAKGTLRFQLGFDYFGSSDFLEPKDTHRATSGTLSVGVTPIEHLEVFGSVASRSSSNDRGNPILLQAAGDFALGAKGYMKLTPWLAVGADLRAMLLNTIGDVGITAGGTSVGLRFAGTADFRHLSALRLPVILRANVGYLLDNSSKLVEETEKDRYNALPAASRRAPADEDRHLINRIERFGLGINRVDMLGLALGVEVPLRLAEDLFLQPIVEWQLGVPVNRQQYDCLAVPTDLTINNTDGCLAVSGLKAAPSTLTLGARVLPPVRGLSALVAFDIGLMGTSTFVRELAPNRPWGLLVSVAYATDTHAGPAEVRYVERRVEVERPAGPAAPVAVVESKVRVRGEVVERGSGKPVIGAVVRYPGQEFTPQLTSADGVFISYALPAATQQLALDITHPDYETGHCEIALGAPTAPTAPAAPAAPAAQSGLTPIGVEPSAPAPAAAGDRMVPARCELTALPTASNLIGAVTDREGKPLAGVQVTLKGPVERSLTSGPSGEVSAEGLPPGDYVAQVNVQEYLFKSEHVSVVPGGNASVRLSLTPRPRVSQALLTTKEVRIGMPVQFNPGSAQLDTHSTPLLTEVVDVLARNPSVRVEVQGHTDNSGDPAQNKQLSQQRAESVLRHLVEAGIDASRLEAKGYGDEQPLVPNLTPENRARNRRVQFMLIKP